MLNQLKKALYWSGAGAAYVRTRRPSGAVILMFHSVPGPEVAGWVDPTYALSPDDFRTRMRYLLRHRRVVSMRELLESSTSGKALPAGTVVVTFDDGYLDNYATALPILDELRLPATVYLATRYVEEAEPQWIDRLYCAFKARSQESLDLIHHGLSRWDLATRDGVDGAYRSIARHLITADWDGRKALLEDVEAQLQPLEAPPRLTMNWDEVRQIHANPLFEIGGHTRHHIDLSTCDADQVEAEVRGCVADIEKATGAAPTQFSYPYGRFVESARAQLEAAGVACATVTDPGRPIGGGDDRLKWPRFDGVGDATSFRFETSGASPGLTRLLFRQD